MSYLVFARKYRPQNFDAVIEQAHVTRTLTNAIAAGRVAHAILFSGPRGTGKTTIARIMAKAMNCAQGPTAHPCGQCRSCLEIQNGHAADVFEIDGASNNSVDQIRDLRDNLKYMPSHSRYKIFIIDEVHMLSLAAFNALLKTLEEPPKHVLFMFATTESHKIPVTILSRCQRHDLRRIELPAIVTHLKTICDQEGVQIEDQSLVLVAQEAGGSMRDALSLLDHVLACAEGEITGELVADLLGAVERKHLFAFSEAVFSRDVANVLEKIDAVWRHGLEMKRFYADLVHHFHQLAMVRLGDRSRRLVDVPAHELRQMTEQIENVPEPYLLQVLELLFQAEQSVKFSSQPRLALELLFIKLFQTPPTLSIERLVAGLEQLRTAAPSELKVAPDQHPVAPDGEPVRPPSEPQGGHTHAAKPQPAAMAESPTAEPVSRDEGADQDPWEEILRRVENEKPALGAVLRKSRIVAMGKDRWQIEVSGNEFNFKSVQRQSQILESYYTEMTGRTLALQLLSDFEDTDERQKKKQQNEQFKQNALGHPLVMEALELFNGKIVDVKVP